MAKKPTEFLVSNEKHTFTLRVGDKVFVTSRRSDPYGQNTVKAPDFISVREVTEIIGGKKPSVQVGGTYKFSSEGKNLGYGSERLEPYNSEREAKYATDFQNHIEMSRASDILSYLQRGKWQIICNDPVKRTALIALLGDDVPELKGICS